MDTTRVEIKEPEVEEIKDLEPVCTEPRLTFVPPKLEKHGDIGTNTLFPVPVGSPL